MSRTVRRQSGDTRYKNPNRRNYNNPYWCFSPLDYRYYEVEVIEKTPLPSYLQYPYCKTRYRVTTTTKWVKKLVGVKTPDMTKTIFDKKVVAKMQRDGYKSKNYVKEYARDLRRSQNRTELARLKKIQNFEDMDYTPKNSDVGLWWYYD